MNKFTDFMGEEWDLDNLDIYPVEWKNMNVHDLFTLCMQKAGESIFYMDYLHYDIDWGKQRDRVIILCKKLSDIWNKLRKFSNDSGKCVLLNEGEYRFSLMKWLWIFEDETENQC